MQASSLLPRWPLRPTLARSRYQKELRAQGQIIVRLLLSVEAAARLRALAELLRHLCLVALGKPAVVGARVN